jgi:two-component system response regulator QseB
VNIAHSARLLLVEDDRELSALLERMLTGEGYSVTTAIDGHRGLHLGLTGTFDVMVIDRGLPAVEGLDLIARLRANAVSTPILVLSARGSTHDRVHGLDAGAEDYLAKPFDVSELLARLRALVRRHGDSAAALPVPGGQYLPARRKVHRSDGTELELSEREGALLHVLASRPTQVFTRDELLRRVFDDAESHGAVDTYVHYLRRKLGKEVVRTVRGLGYRLGAL